MYNQYLKVLPTKNGDGLFTSVDIPARVPIFECRGDFSKESNVDASPNAVQVGHNTFLGPSGGPNDKINHSCNPNCYLHIVGTRAIVFSLYQIKSNSELTFDYSTSSTDTLDEWKMECNCGSYNCRKTISGFQYLDPKVQEDYKNRKMIPLFITHNIFMK
jgi:SET domain